ncbi:hypothetical protein Tco_1209800 [Tanacetum coccineum]
MVEVPYTAEYNVFAVDTQHYKQPECIINTCVVEKVKSNVIPDSPDMCDNEIQTDHNVVECDDERVTLANLILNLKRNIDENKMIQKKLKKANALLTQELKECKSTLAETSRTLGESNSIQDSFLVALQNKLPSGRLSVPAVLIPGCPALPCKVSSLVAVETLHLGLIKPSSFFVGHVQLPSSILQESACPHSQHSNVPLKSILLDIMSDLLL